MSLAPEYQALLDGLAAEPGPTFAEMGPEGGREAYRLMRPLNPELAVGEVRDGSAPGPAGDISLRIYTPEGAGPFPVLVYFHGGGWVIGDLDTADAACRDLCRTAGCVVVSVDYRLAPEHPYPAAVDDAYAATRWAADNAQALNGNGRLAVGGESAGGNLAAVVSLRARDLEAPQIDFQLLAYPVTDCDLSRESYQRLADGYLLTTETMQYFWDIYCPDPDQRARPDASPIRAASLADLPPALVVVGEYDPLVDECRAYAGALERAGSTVELMVCDGLIHDFFATAALFQASRPPFEAACGRLKAALTE